jgi:hypothetical protein
MARTPWTWAAVAAISLPSALVRGTVLQCLARLINVHAHVAAIAIGHYLHLSVVERDTPKPRSPPTSTTACLIFPSSDTSSGEFHREVQHH